MSNSSIDATSVTAASEVESRIGINRIFWMKESAIRAMDNTSTINITDTGENSFIYDDDW